MKEIDAIIRKYDEWASAGKSLALAMVVQVEGSAYRRPGARMLVCDDGRSEGGISGGCLDSDVIKRAKAVIHDKSPVLITYDSITDDEGTPEASLGCNGIVRVLISPVISSNKHNSIELLKKAIETRRPHIVATSFIPGQRKQTSYGLSFVMSQDEVVFGHGGPVGESYLRYAREALKECQSRWEGQTENQSESWVFYEYMPPCIRLVVAGSGADVGPLAAMSQMVGWETVLVDGKSAQSLSGISRGGCHVLPAKPDEVLDKVIPDDHTVFVLMTHNYKYDKELLYILCTRDITHISMLGPAKKLERMLKEYKEEGRPLDTEQLNRIHSPAGLDIGAETPEEIALSIIAEIKAGLSHSSARPLRLKTGAIHT